MKASMSMLEELQVHICTINLEEKKWHKKGCMLVSFLFYINFTVLFVFRERNFVHMKSFSKIEIDFQ